MLFIFRLIAGCVCALSTGFFVGMHTPEVSFPSKVAPTTKEATSKAAAPAPVQITAEPKKPPRDAERGVVESPELKTLRSMDAQFFRELAETPAPQPPADRREVPLILTRDDSTPAVLPPTDASTSVGSEDVPTWLVGLERPDLPMKFEGRVEPYVRYFSQTTQGRKVFRNWLRRSGRYRAQVASALRAKDLPQDLAALVFIESGFSSTAVSSAGAAGLWQLMPETARVYGLAVEDDYDERRSVDKSSAVAARHLSDLYGRFGSWELALAAYDLGYQGMLGRVQRLGSNDFWTLSRVEGALPRETILYVPKVAAIALILRNLERFGFQDTRVDPAVSSYDIDVPSGIELALVARAAGTSLQVLRELNPEMLTDIVPDRGRPFPIHIPGAGAARARTMLPQLLEERTKRSTLDGQVSPDFNWGNDEYDVGRRPQAPPDREPLRRPSIVDPPVSSTGERVPLFYRVGDGDTLDSIARTFKIRPKDIVDDNALDPVAKMQRGMLLELRVDASALAQTMRKRRVMPQRAESSRKEESFDDFTRIMGRPGVVPAPRIRSDSAKRRVDVGGPYFRKVRMLR